MRFVPRFTSTFLDSRLNSLFRDILLCFQGIPDTNTYKFEVVWVVPFTMSVPTQNNTPRTSSPDVVECKRAIDVANPTTPVLFGACHWNWIGDNSVRIENVDGLIAGTRYQLTFQVSG